MKNSSVLKFHLLSSLDVIHCFTRTDFLLPGAGGSTAISHSWFPKTRLPTLQLMINASNYVGFNLCSTSQSCVILCCCFFLIIILPFLKLNSEQIDHLSFNLNANQVQAVCMKVVHSWMWARRAAHGKWFMFCGSDCVFTDGEKTSSGSLLVVTPDLHLFGGVFWILRWAVRSVSDPQAGQSSVPAVSASSEEDAGSA